MRTLFSILLLCVGYSGIAQNANSYDYCFTNGKGILLYSKTDKKESLVIKNANNPSLSPDGTKIACTLNSSKGDRQVVIVDIATRKTTIMNTGSLNCYAPVWSPDGQYLAYNVYLNSVWYIAIIDKDNHAPFVLTRDVKGGMGSFAPSWTSDSRKVLVQNTETVFVLNLKGNILEKYLISTLIDKSDGSSSSTFVLSKDEKKIVFDNGVDEKGYEGPAPAVFVYDKTMKSTSQISPKGYHCTQFYLKRDKVFFAASKGKSNITNVYSMDMDGKNLKLEYSNCWEFSIRPD